MFHFINCLLSGSYLFFFIVTPTHCENHAERVGDSPQTIISCLLYFVYTSTGLHSVENHNYKPPFDNETIITVITYCIFRRWHAKEVDCHTNFCTTFAKPCVNAKQCFELNTNTSRLTCLSLHYVLTRIDTN